VYLSLATVSEASILASSSVPFKSERNAAGAGHKSGFMRASELEGCLRAAFTVFTHAALWAGWPCFPFCGRLIQEID